MTWGAVVSRTRTTLASGTISAVRPDVVLAQTLGIGPKCLVGLHVHPVRARLLKSKSFT